MRKLVTTFNGGMPDYLDNFRWFESGMIEALSLLCKGVGRGAEAYRLFGVDIVDTGSAYEVSAGAVYFQNEVFQVDAHTRLRLPDNVPQTYFWGVITTYDPSGALTYENQVTRQTYAIRKAQLFQVTAILAPGTFIPVFIPRLEDIIAGQSALSVIQSSLTQLQNSYNAYSNETGTAYFQYTQVGIGETLPDFENIPFQRRVGVLNPPGADLQVVNGMYYMIVVHESTPSMQLRLGEQELYLGSNIYYEQGFNQPTTRNFRWMATGNVRIAVICLGRYESAPGSQVVLEPG